MSTNRNKIPLEGGLVAISFEYLEELENESRKLCILESWGGYSEAMAEYYGEDDDD